VLADLLNRAMRGNQFGFSAHIDAHVAWVSDGRAGNQQVDLAGASRAQHAHQRSGGIATHNAVIDHDQAFISHVVFNYAEFEGYPLLAERVGRLDEPGPLQSRRLPPQKPRHRFLKKHDPIVLFE
jgi:hypothetical protein